MNIVPSSDWKQGPWSSNAKQQGIIALVWHYQGGNQPLATGLLEDSKKILRAIDADYTKNRGYSIGYTHAIDAGGHVFELRGWNHGHAANPANPASRPWNNGNTMSCLLLLPTVDSPPTQAMILAAREWSAYMNGAVGKVLPHKCHYEVSSTGCPGAVLADYVHRGEFEARPPSPSTPPGDDDVNDQEHEWLATCNNMAVVGMPQMIGLLTEILNAVKAGGMNGASASAVADEVARRLSNG